MSKSKIMLQSTNQWDDSVLFPVVCRPLTDLLPEYQVRASDRQNLIIGNGNTIFGIQGLSYTLIPNQLVYDVVNEVIGEHEVKIFHNSRGEFSINVHLPNVRYEIGSRTDTIQKNLIINNSYNGRSHFTVQGKVVGSATDQVRERGMKVSYYRQVCSNGLMGWTDEFMNMDEYLDWLLKGQPVRDDVRKFKVEVDDGVGEVEREQEQLMQKTFKHKSLKLDLFAENLTVLIKSFMEKQDSLTLKVYERMAEKRVYRADANEVLIDAGLPKQLATMALERLDLETKQLESVENAWLLYNAGNSALFSQKSGLSIEKRFEFDSKLFHNLNNLLLA